MWIETTMTWKSRIGKMYTCEFDLSPTSKQQSMGEGSLSSVILIGRSWRTWKTNLMTPTYLNDILCKFEGAPPHLEPAQLHPHPPPIPLECRRISSSGLITLCASSISHRLSSSCSDSEIASTDSESGMSLHISALLKPSAIRQH